MILQLREAQRRFGPIGVAGVSAVGEVVSPSAPGPPLAAGRVGWLVDRGRLLHDGPELPAQVATFDELLLAVPWNTPLRFDPPPGFHLYEHDASLLTGGPRFSKLYSSKRLPSSTAEPQALTLLMWVQIPREPFKCGRLIESTFSSEKTSRHHIEPFRLLTRSSRHFVKG